MTGSTRALSLSEIRARVDSFVSEWREETSERAEAQSFWNDLLACFGVQRRRVATFERQARRASTGRSGRIDLFWPSVLIAEQKSAGLLGDDAAEQQATDYLSGGDISAHEWPRYILSSDFRSLRVTDLEAPAGSRETVTFLLDDLAAHVEDLAWLAGYEARSFTTAESEAVSVQAATLMARLYVALAGDEDVELVRDADEEDEASLAVSILLTRLLFLMFGDDAGLWQKGLFDEFLRARTSEDGSDLGGQLVALFDVLNTREDRRPARVDPAMAAFPYINGALFDGTQPPGYFDRAMREALLEASAFDWTKISPAVFGSLFQAIKSKVSRRAAGEHYTTEENILKTLGPLFLDDLNADLDRAWNQVGRLRTLHDRIGAMQYLDPACGCGNFLVVAYREMRALELRLLVRTRELQGVDAALTLDGTWDLRVRLDQFHGIEIAWWPAKIAETAMFLVDHQANRAMALALGQAPERLPITMTADIHHHNALTLDWSDVLPATRDTVVFGNPPFIGQYTRSEEQAADLRAAWGDRYDGYLDFVTAWHAKTLDFFADVDGRWAYVTTNSITQGDPVYSLFGAIFDRGWQISFAHRTFAWTSEATGAAAVHCVIVGFARTVTDRRRLFDYPTAKSMPHEVPAKQINAYLIDGPNVLVTARRTPLCPDLPPVIYGSKPVDGGALVIEPDAIDEFLNDPIAAPYVRPFVGAAELKGNVHRWCLWLENLDPVDVGRSALLRGRIERTRAFREQSAKASTRKAAQTPHLFVERRQPDQPYLCIPIHVSENPRYFVAQRFDADIVASNAVFTALDPDGLLFALISSSMFIAWQRAVGGRIKSDLRFSSTVVWQNLPLPLIDERTRGRVIEAGRGVLSARGDHHERSLTGHYNPLAMDAALVRAHDRLDVVVDRAFGAAKTCKSERERQALLFERYSELATSARRGAAEEWRGNA